MILPSIEEFYSEISQLIKTERLRKNITQEQIANILNLTRASVINLENGRHRPSLYQLLQIANFLKIDFDILIPTLDVKSNKVIDTALLDEGITEDGPIDETTKEAVGKFLSEL